MREPVGIIGFSGSGKTTLVTELVRLFSGRGERVAVVKHTHHHAADLADGGDTRRALDAGASIVVVADDHEAVRWNRNGERFGPDAYDDPRTLVTSIEADRVFVEGWKELRLWAALLVEGSGFETMRPADGVAAVVSDVDHGLPVPRFEPHDLSAIADFVDKLAGA